MQIPAYWSKAEADDIDREGKRLSFACWRSSDDSLEDARASALEAAKRILRRLVNGERLERYAYGNGPMREEILQRLTDAQGNLIAAVTRNSYGALILNAEQVAFIDLDFPPISPGDSLRYFFQRWFNKSARAPAAQREWNAVQALKRLTDANPRWGLRLYRTCAGMRALLTHDLFDAASESTLAMLRSVDCDPLYVRLCKIQNCFRARLTPKPWRCGHAAVPPRWPIENQEDQARFDQWQSAYATRHVSYATCRFLGALGNDAVHPVAAAIIEIHDSATRCNEPLELA